jgi:hypothetical protein
LTNNKLNFAQLKCKNVWSYFINIVCLTSRCFALIGTQTCHTEDWFGMCLTMSDIIIMQFFGYNTPAL